MDLPISPSQTADIAFVLVRYQVHNHSQRRFVLARIKPPNLQGADSRQNETPLPPPFLDSNKLIFEHLAIGSWHLTQRYRWPDLPPDPILPSIQFDTN
jgi:hypothetical protein